MEKGKQRLKESIASIAARLSIDDILTGNVEDIIARTIEMVDELEGCEMKEEQAWEVIADKYGEDTLKNNVSYVKAKGYVVSEVPVIPQFVADFIESYRNQCLHSALQSAYEGFEDLQVYNWINNGKREETLTRAWLDGYEVEKDPQWVIKDDNGNYFVSYPQRMEDEFDFDGARTIASIYKRNGMTFIDKSKAEAVAYLIGGEVEEAE